MRRLAPLLLLLAGCKADPDAALVGTWAMGNDAIAFTSDKKYAAEIRGASIAGTWARSGQKVTLSPATYNGKPVAEQAAQLSKSVSRLNSTLRKQARALVASVAEAQSLTLSADGQTLAAGAGAWSGLSLKKRGS